MRSITSSIVWFSWLALAAGGSAHGAGFQLLEQNASGLGNAYAGSAAVAENASTIYFNPAGMSQLSGLSVSAGISAIRPSFKFRNDGSTPPAAAPLTDFAGAGNGGDAGKWGLVPNAYLAWQVDERWHVGVGFGAPFGLMTDYDDNWLGKYHSNKFEITTININPSVSYRVNDQWSVGAGLNWQRIDAEYTRRTVVVPGLLASDAKVEVDSDAWGWNAGVMFQPTEDTRLGLSYRSKIRHKATGDTDLAGVGSFDARANVTLPDTAILSAYHRLDSRWELLADISWTGWSSIEELNIRNTGIPGDSLQLDFRDTWRIAVGANYRLDPAWKLKFGVAWDQSPVHRAGDRPTSLPDNDRWWFSAGIQYQATANTTIDLGYTYLYLDDTRIDNRHDLATKGRVAGDYDSKGNIIGLQISSRF